MNLFGTTDKSNFILNMKASKMRSMILKFTIAMCCLVLVVGFVYLVNSSTVFLGSAALSIFGFGGVLMFVIALLKKETSVKNPGIILVLALAVLACFSALFAINKSSVIYGISGRYEGIVSLLAYTGVFLVGAVITPKKDTETLLKVILGIVAINAVIGILQSVPAFNFPSYYKDLETLSILENTGIFLASGTTGSPIFLATLLTIGFAIAMSAACYAKSDKSIVYIIIADLIVVASAFTRSVVAVIGICAVFVTLIAIELVRRKKGSSKDFEKSPLTKILAAFAFAVVVYVGLYLLGIVHFWDKEIAFKDSFYRCFTTGALTSRLENFYAQTWGGSILIALKFPIFGTGPDGLIHDQIRGMSLVPNSFDKSYNEFLYVAATRGLISFGVYLAFAVWTLKRAFGGVKEFFANGQLWTKVAIATTICAYLVQSFFSVSVITVAPYFWLIAGLVWADYKFQKNSAK